MSAAAWPVAALAQQGDPVRRIGVITGADENESKARTSLLAQALSDLGWTEGRNVRIDRRWSGDDNDRIKAVAQELVRLQPDIIVTGGVPATAAVQRETRTIPIVFQTVADPVASGLVARLERPGGNITGFATSEASMGGKWVQLLSEIAPGLKRAVIIFNPDTGTTAASPFLPSLETAARSLMVEPIFRPVHTDEEIEASIMALGREPGSGLVIMPDIFTNYHRASIILTAARAHVPAISWQSDFARDGGLLSYGADIGEPVRRAASYVDRILRGEKPGDLPVQFPVKYEMVVNLKTAKALGLAVPQSILLRADEVIQ
jgi:putative tryptophan/tyrosine transport system substrate-binding protein